MSVAQATRIDELSVSGSQKAEENVSAAWAAGLFDELASQLAKHPAFDALVRMRVSEALAETGRASARRWYTTDEAAELLGCSRDAIRMRVNRGRLDHRRQGRRIYVSAASVDLLGRAA